MSSDLAAPAPDPARPDPARNDPARNDPAGMTRAAYGRALEPLLGSQLARLRRRYLWHGAGFALLLPAAAIALFFALDHSLHLPLPVRLFHTVAVLALVGFALARFLAYPLSRQFTSIDVAQVLERSFPELHQRLVSAVQLQGLAQAGLRNQSSAMIDALVQETAEATQRLPLDRFLDPRRTRRVMAAAGAVCGMLAIGSLLAPATARAFLLRHLGMAAEYPRQTYLTVDLPAEGPELQRHDGDGVVELLLPAGGELHVSVLAQGAVPKEVFLDIAPLAEDPAAADAQGRPGRTRGARSIPMAPRPGDRFRHVFRKVSGSFEFHARGGDDEHGDRLVRVRTVHPPQVAAIRALISPPAYTGVETIEQTGGAIEALVGSEVELLITTTAAVQSAAVLFLESGRRLELIPTTIQDDSGAATAYRTQFTIQASDRYQVELLGGSGLRNPNPGTYPISGLVDYAPVGRWLLPDDEATLLLPTALLCVRVAVRDDFGIAEVAFAAERAGAAVHTQSLFAGRHVPRDGVPKDGVPQDGATGPPPKSAVFTELFEVSDLLTGGRGGEGLSLAITVRDNCEPVAGNVELPRRIVQIVDGQQLADATAKAFRRLREEASQALDVQVDRRQRLLDLSQRESVPAGEMAQILSAVEVGQSRVLGNCDRLHRGLMRAFDVHLWNRLEASQNAATVVQLYREFSRDLNEPLGLAPAFYRDLIQRRAAGTLGPMETALDPILQMIGVADRLANIDVPAAARGCAEAQVAPTQSGQAGNQSTQRAQIVQQTLKLQGEIAEALQQLLFRLEEWNDYQDMVQEARALRDRQRDLQFRTEEVRGTPDPNKK